VQRQHRGCANGGAAPSSPRVWRGWRSSSPSSVRHARPCLPALSTRQRRCTCGEPDRHSFPLHNLLAQPAPGHRWHKRLTPMTSTVRPAAGARQTSPPSSLSSLFSQNCLLVLLLPLPIRVLARVAGPPTVRVFAPSGVGGTLKHAARLCSTHPPTCAPLTPRHTHARSSGHSASQRGGLRGRARQPLPVTVPATSSTRLLNPRSLS